MARTHYKILSINRIFQKVEGVYSKEALLYQNILEYPVKTSKPNYKFSEMAKWLIENNREFRDFYGWNSSVLPKTTRSYAIAKKKNRIQERLDDLIQLGLVKFAGKTKAEKVDTEVKLYQNTNEGNLLALVINRLGRSSYAEIYNLMRSILDSNTNSSPKDSSSGDIFLKSFLKVCKEKNIFHQLINFFLQRMESQDEIDIINNTSRLLHELINLRWFKNEHDISTLKQFGKFSYADIWSESYDRLDEKPKKLLLARYKSIFETPSKYPLSFKWELTKYDYASNEREIVLLANCTLCGNNHSIIRDTLQWLHDFFIGNLTVEDYCDNKKQKCELNILPFQD